MTQLEISVHFRIELISVQYSYISISLLIPHTWRKSLKPNTLWIVNQNTFISMHHTHLNFWWSVIWLNLYANREGFLFSWLREFAGAIISCANVESTLLIVLCIARLYVYLHRQFIFVFTYICVTVMTNVSLMIFWRKKIVSILYNEIVDERPLG